MENLQILVRSECREVEEAVRLASTKANRDMFVVTGQPCIGMLSPFPIERSNVQLGKSVFLLWFLVHRLAHELPTVLQINEDSVIPFHERGVSELTRRGNGHPYDPLCSPPLGRIWALVDTSPALSEPAAVIKHASPFFVVNAVPPRDEYTMWFSKVNYQVLYMKP